MDEVERVALKSGIVVEQNAWTAKLWECGQDWFTCCYGYCLPGCMFGENAAEVEGNDQRCAHALRYYAVALGAAVAGTLVGGAGVALAMAAGSAPGAGTAAVAACALATWVAQLGPAVAVNAAIATYAAPRRRQLREQEGLPEEPCSDWCTWFWCPACSACQEAAQLRSRRQSAVELGASLNYGRLAVEPPKQQAMK